MASLEGRLLTVEVAKNLLPSFSNQLVENLRNPQLDPLDTIREGLRHWGGEYGVDVFGDLFSDDARHVDVVRREFSRENANMAEWAFGDVGILYRDWTGPLIHSLLDSMPLGESYIPEAQRVDYALAMHAPEVGLLTAEEILMPGALNKKVVSAFDARGMQLPSERVQLLADDLEKVFITESGSGVVPQIAILETHARAVTRLLAHGVVYGITDISVEPQPRLLNDHGHYLCRIPGIAKRIGLPIREVMLFIYAPEQASHLLDMWLFSLFSENTGVIKVSRKELASAIVAHNTSLTR